MKTKFVVLEDNKLEFNYHIGTSNNPFLSLCGIKTTPTRILISQYNSIPFHDQETWCQKCMEIKYAR